MVYGRRVLNLQVSSLSIVTPSACANMGANIDFIQWKNHQPMATSVPRSCSEGRKTQ